MPPARTLIFRLRSAKLRASRKPSGIFVKVKIAIERSLVVPAPYRQMTPLLQDLEGTIGRFPKLKKLTRIGDNRYLWDMHRIGSRIANIAHEVSYAAHYHVDLNRGVVSWQPLPGHGNASIEGSFRFIGDGDETRLEFKVQGELRDVPVPLLYRPIAPAFIQNRFSTLVEVFLERTGAAVIGEHATAAVAQQQRANGKSSTEVKR
ncbi:MAG: hypothetical protein JWR16_2289 [Nevskia sp.]|nr:hypothetical protein [Nevskia sp.]